MSVDASIQTSHIHVFLKVLNAYEREIMSKILPEDMIKRAFSRNKHIGMCCVPITHHVRMHLLHMVCLVTYNNMYIQY